MSTQLPEPKESPDEPTPDPVALRDRLVIVLFLVVGVLFGVYLLVDLIFGLFR